MARANDSAFPYRSRWDSNTEGYDITEVGLTKREYFAAMAMQGFCAANYGNFKTDDHKQRIAECSVKQADALIAELNKYK